MTKKTFEKILNISIEKGKKENIIYNNGLDLINFIDEYQTIISLLFKSIYGESTYDIISDFIMDSINDELEVNKGNYVISESKTNNIIADCSTLDGLYGYCEKTRQELISENYKYEIDFILN